MLSKPRTIDQKVTDIIRKIGVPAHLKGYYYVRDAILLVIENDDFIQAASIMVYPVVAEKHGTTPSRVKQNITHCISAASRRGNMPFINLLFGPVNGIGNKEFIVTIAHLIQNRYLDVAIYEDLHSLI